MQPTFFDGLTHPAVEKLRSLDVNQLTPLEAMKLLDELARESRRGISAYAEVNRFLINHEARSLDEVHSKKVVFDGA